MTSNLKFVHTGNSITLMLGSRPYSIASTDAVYPEVITLVKANATEDEILAVINRAIAAVQAATQITPNIAIKNGVVLFKGQSIDNSLTTRMLSMLDEGFDLKPMAYFLENLMANPSYTAVSELYSFLEKGQMPITPDGHFMAYKAVRGDFKDIHSGTFDNSIGQVCEMPRFKVDDDRSRTCSAGLHFCSFEYLPYFAHQNGHVMLLKINPADVVSIPADYNDTKGRCARYEVVGEYEGYYKEGGPFFTTSVFDPASLNETDAEDYEFELYGLAQQGQEEDGDYIGTFDSVADAVQAANDDLTAYGFFEIRTVDGDVVDTVEGEKVQYSVVCDGDVEASTEDLALAKDMAIDRFASMLYGTVSVVDNFSGDSVLEMHNN